MLSHQLETDQISPLPSELDSAQGKLVYLYLEATGGTTVSDLNQTLSMQKMAILSVLNSLESQGLIEKRDSEYALCA